MINTRGFEEVFPASRSTVDTVLQATGTMFAQLANQQLTIMSEVEARKQALDAAYLELQVAKTNKTMALSKIYSEDAEVRNQKSADLRDNMAQSKISDIVLTEHQALVKHIKAQTAYEQSTQALSHLRTLIDDTKFYVEMLKMASSSTHISQ